MEQEQFDFLEDIEIDKPDVEFQKWKDQKREAKSRMIAMQYQPYEVKKKRSELRAIEFLQEMDKRGKVATTLRRRAPRSVILEMILAM